MIRRKVTCYAAVTVPVRAEVAAPTALDIAETIRAYAAERGDAEVTGLVDAFVAPSGECDGALDLLEREHEAALAWAAHCEGERLADYYTPEHEPRFADTAEIDVLDLTGLEPKLASVLALKLARWNNGGRVYNRRNGRCYLHRDIRHLDVNDPTVQSPPNYDDFVSMLKERGVHA